MKTRSRFIILVIAALVVASCGTKKRLQETESNYSELEVRYRNLLSELTLIYFIWRRVKSGLGRSESWCETELAAFKQASYRITDR